MAHIVVRQGKYVSIEESVRVPGRKTPKKRVIRYFGVRSPDFVKAVRRAKGDGVDWAKLEREELARMKSEEALHQLVEQAQQTDFKGRTGLDLPRNEDVNKPVPVDKTPSLAQSAQVSDDAAEGDVQGNDDPLDM